MLIGWPTEAVTRFAHMARFCDASVFAQAGPVVYAFLLPSSFQGAWR